MGNSCAISSSRLSYLRNTLLRYMSRVVWLPLAGSFVILVYLPDSQKSKCIAYGGEDQKIAMASKPGKNVTVEVKSSGSNNNTSRSKSRGRNRNVKITVNSQPQKGRRRNRPNNRGRKRVESVVKRQLDKAGVTGPKPAITQTATSTLGTVGPNTSGAVELELATFMNPCLVKESTASNSFGPIQASAAQYNLWRVTKAQVRLTPMVGPSAISGTAYRVSLNTAGTPSSTGWSGLGARKHKDVRVGAISVFNVTSRDMAGPREGWFVTNTNESGGESVGPTIELHSLGETKSTYQNSSYSGPVFLVELRCTWQFTNYSANPALAQLEKGEDRDAQIKFEGEAGQPLKMVIQPHSSFARALELRSAMPYSGNSRAVGESTSDTIWQIASTAVDATSVVVPPPFNWLIKGGWWSSKLAGRARTGEVEVQVYASYEDAQNNRPAICTGSVSGDNTPRQHTVKFVQMNSPSTGMPPESALGAFSLPIPPAPDTPAVIGDNFKLVTGVFQQYQQNPPCPTYLYHSYNKVVVKVGQHYDEINFIFRATTPHIWLAGTQPNFQLATKPTAVTFMEIGQKSNSQYLRRGEIWGYSQHKVSSTNGQSVLTFYVGKLDNQIRFSNYKQVRYAFTGNGSTTSLNPLPTEVDLQYLDLNPGPWFIFVSMHFVNTSLHGFIATENPSKPTIVCPAVAQNLLVCTSNTVASTMNIDFLRTPPTVSQLTTESAVPQMTAAINALPTIEEEQIPTPLEGDFLPDSEDEDFSDDDSLLDDDDFFPASDEQVFSSRQVLFRAMVNEGWPEDQAERLAKRALPTLSEKELRDEFLVGLADGFSPRQAAANAREKCSRGHAE
nr:capsid protein [Canine astrovirus]